MTLEFNVPTYDSHVAEPGEVGVGKKAVNMVIGLAGHASKVCMK